MVNGIDASYWQGEIDFKLARAAGAKFAIIRTSVGFATDTRGGKNLANAKDAGIPVGAYHAFRTYRDSVDQAEHFWSTVTYNIGDLDLPPALDIEEDIGLGDYGKRVLDCATRLEEISGWRPLIYTRKYLWDLRITDDTGLGRYGLWVADYTQYRGQPIIPGTWKDSTWTFWQWGTEAGEKYGASSKLIPVDRYNGNTFLFFLYLLFNKWSRLFRS